MIATVRHTAFVGALWSLSIAGLCTGSIIGTHIRGVQFGPNAALECSRALGVAYTYEDGATEHLAAFEECVTKKGGRP